MAGGQGGRGGQERWGVAVSHGQSGLHQAGALSHEVRIETVDIVVQRRHQLLLLGGNKREVVKTGF